MKKIIFLIVANIWMATIVQAQVINLNSSRIKATATNIIPSEFLKEAKTGRVFDINPVLQSVENIKQGDEIAFQLFEKQNYKAEISSIVTDVNGTLVLSLKFPEYPAGFAIITTSREGKSHVNISIPELRQTFGSQHNAQANEYYLIEEDESKHWPAPLDNDAVAIPETKEASGTENNEENTSQLRSAQAACNPPRAGDNADAPATISLLIVYTPAAAASDYTSRHGGIENVIASMIALGNLSLENSLTNITLELAHSTQISYTENNDMLTSLHRLHDIGDGYMDEVHTLRTRYNADLVQLLTTDNNSGGYGYRLSTTYGYYSYGFSVCWVTQVADTYPCSIHEIGHNMGLGHGAQQTSVKEGGIYEYAQGWRWIGSDNKYYTSVMSYSGNYYGDGIISQYVPYFSNPNVKYKDVATGHAVRADAARSLRNLKHVVASYSEMPDLDKPTNIVVSNLTGNGATVSWDAVPRAFSYAIYVYNNNAWRLCSNTSTNSCTFNNATYFSPCKLHRIYVRALKECDTEFTDSNEITFTTACPTDPTVETHPATDITLTSAKLNKVVTQNGVPVTGEGFKYKAISSSTWTNSLDGNLTGLIENTQYQFYAYATTTTNTFNGSILTFTTATCDIADKITYTVEMQDAYGNGWNSASLKIRQDNADAKSMTLLNGYAGSDNVLLCPCLPFEVVWDRGGAYPYECSFVIKDNNGQQIFATPPGSSFSSTTAGCAGYTNGQTVFNGTTNCKKSASPIKYIYPKIIMMYQNGNANR